MISGGPGVWEKKDHRMVAVDEPIPSPRYK